MLFLSLLYIYLCPCCGYFCSVVLYSFIYAPKQFAEVSALRLGSGSGQSYSLSSKELESQIISLEAQLKQKDETIEDLQSKMYKNMTEYAELVSG